MPTPQTFPLAVGSKAFVCAFDQSGNVANVTVFVPFTTADALAGAIVATRTGASSPFATISLPDFVASVDWKAGVFLYAGSNPVAGDLVNPIWVLPDPLAKSLTASPGAKMDLVDAPNAVALAAAAAAVDSVLSGSHGSGAWGSSGSAGYSGTARGGTSTTIQLASSASSGQNYVGQLVTTNFGLLTQEVHPIVSYDGTTKTATISGAWTNTPTNTTPYVIGGTNLPPVLNVTQNVIDVVQT